ncbi:MAG TPA: hypothetical protein VFA05_06160 [Gaiellaceae bacterium]|nr:hypothetical protein [Gaiellaceae bacterium]
MTEREAARGGQRPGASLAFVFRRRGAAGAVLALTAALAVAAIAAASPPAPQLPLPCGLPHEQPLWVDYADGQVPFWSTIFARPGIVAAASQLIVPPQLRAKGAKTVYFDLYLTTASARPRSLPTRRRSPRGPTSSSTLRSRPPRATTR